jgi:nucleoside-diphosphate-sugar epimerase
LDREERNQDSGATLIIGGSGYVGGRIAKAEARKSSSRVVIFDNAPPAPAQGLDRIKFIKGSILNQGELIEAIKKENVSKIVHTSYMYSGEARERPAEAAKYNFLGTVNVLECARLFDVHKLIYSSAGAVYGSLDRDALISEEFPKTPRDFYGATKLSSENYGRLYRDTYGVPFISLRMMGAYSPDLNIPTVSYYVTNGLVKSAVKGEPIFLDLDPGELVTLVYLDDAINAFSLALEKDCPSAAYNLASETIPISDIVDEITKSVPEARIELNSPKGKDQRNLYLSQHVRGTYDISRLKNELGFEPRNLIKNTMTSLIDWQRKSREL